MRVSTTERVRVNELELQNHNQEQTAHSRDESMPAFTCTEDEEKQTRL
jgi:hypothetical protein